MHPKYLKPARKMKLTESRQLDMIRQNPWNICIIDKPCKEAQLYILNNHEDILNELKEEDIFNEIAFMDF